MAKSFHVSIIIAVVIVVVIIIIVQSWFLSVTAETDSPFSRVVLFFLAVTQFKQT